MFLNETWWDKNCNIEEFKEMVSTSETRDIVRDYLGNLGKISVLDCGAGLCEDWFVLKDKYPDVHYYAIDITNKFLVRNKKYGINIDYGSIENIPKNNNEFDVVYCRHVLEHLPHFHTALSEMIRVAKKQVIITFFIPPKKKENIFVDENGLNTNTYSRESIESHLSAIEKVISWDWQKKDDEVILFIKL